MIWLNWSGEECTWYRVFVVRGRKNPLFMGLASRLKTARKTAALNRQAVTQRAKLSDVSAVLGMEQGQRIPRLDTVERVACGLGLSPAFLAYGIESDGNQPIEGLRCEGVALRLRQTRIHLGLSVLALATAAGLSHTAVGNVERGTMPTIATAEALATALGVSPGWLAYGLGPMVMSGRRRVTESPEVSPG